MNYSIRQASASDLPYIYDICRLTGKVGKDCTPLISDHHIVGQYFAAPYIHYEMDTCFVVDNGLGLAYRFTGQTF